ncbi:MAG: hypothetical protein ACRCTE_13130 [Cellulosilyticaceae bacterium]
MLHDEFVASVRQRIAQLQNRSKMDWYSTDTLESAIDALRQTLVEYISNRPEFKNEMSEYIHQVDQL